MSKKHEAFGEHFFEFETGQTEILPWNVWTVRDELMVFGRDASFASENSRALLWNLVDNPSVVALPHVSKDNLELARGVWLAVLDLLAFGNGWVNVRRELNAWALRGFEVIDEPVYGRLHRDIGPALYALVWYLNKHDKAAAEIENYLTNIGLPGHISEEEGIYEGHGPNYLSVSEIESFIEVEDLRQKYPLVAFLFEGTGEDPAQLARYFTYRDLTEDDEDRSSVVEIDENHLQVAFDIYPHWYRDLHRIVDDYLDQISDTGVLDHPNGFKVDVWVRGMGFLGQFVFDHERNRFVRDLKILNLGVAHRFGPRRNDFLGRPDLEEVSAPEVTQGVLESDSEDLLHFDSVPEALQNLVRDLVNRTEEKLGKEDAREYVSVLVAFASGNISLTQEEATAEMATLLRVLT